MMAVLPSVFACCYSSAVSAIASPISSGASANDQVSFLLTTTSTAAETHRRARLDGDVDYLAPVVSR